MRYPGAMRILIIEDQDEMRQAVARRLRSDGHGVDEAEDLGTAQSFVQSYRYDVVVLDRILPDGDGLDWLFRWRGREVSTPVLFLTAKDQVADRVDGFEAGGDDYLVKPFAMEELVARLSALARRGVEPRPTRLTVADLHIDLARREVRRGGVLLTLRPKEFGVLELLVRRRGRVVTRDEILGSCWGEELEPASNVEEVVVASLRRKLGPPSLIRTVRGSGYLLEAPRALD